MLTHESTVVADIAKYRKRSVYSSKYNQFTLHGNLWRYVIDRQWVIVTIMSTINDDDYDLVKKNRKKQNFVQLDNELSSLLHSIIFE